MSRYDGLIIPRSYSEYINKTDAATLQQALQLSGVLSGAVAAGDNKAVKSNAVNNALNNYQEYKMISILNGNANDCIPSNSDRVSYYRGTMSNTPFSNTTAVILTSKYYFVGSYHNVYQEVEQYGSSTVNYRPTKYIRYGYKAISETEYTWSDWQKVATENDLSKYEKVFKKTTNGEGTQIVSEAFNALGLNDNKTHTIMMKVENENTNGYILALITYNSNRLSNIIQKTVENNLIYINAVNYVGTIAIAGYSESGNVKNNWTFWS